MLRKVILTSIITIASIIICLTTYYFLLSKSVHSKCDFEGFVIDKDIEGEFGKVLDEFERNHKLNFFSSTLRCDWNKVTSNINYQSPMQFSKYQISYDVTVTAEYSPNSKEFSLKLPNQGIETTDEVLNYLYSVKDMISEFENNPQVEEFAAVFVSQEIELYRTIYGKDIWVETGGKYFLDESYLGYTLSAGIYYSMSTHSIYHYELPNYIKWDEFHEIRLAHQVINEQLLTENWHNA